MCVCVCVCVCVYTCHSPPAETPPWKEVVMLKEKRKFWSHDLCLQLCAGQLCRRLPVSRVGRAVAKEGEEARRDFRWIKEFLTVKDGLSVDVSQTCAPQTWGAQSSQETPLRNGAGH